MEQIYFGQRIAAYRKAQGLTQEGLAQRLGVTNQAVSKWELDQCCPDIMLLPALADVFAISLDELFGRPAVRQDAAPDIKAVPADLPWPDDEDLRAVCYVGHRLMDYADVPEKKVSIGGFFNMHVGSGTPAELHFSGTVRDIRSAYGVVVKDSTIAGDVHAEDGVECGDVGGSVTAGDGVNCSSVNGDVRAGDGVNCGNVGGSVAAGDSVNCGNVGGNVKAGDEVVCGMVSGNVEADRVIGGTWNR
ncbi:MAG: helix-turn-helix domain-containing protein [Ruminococcaceae bacterium]|nr:helix-turn-helix domain-containing protein [Oscillospiraceae bacterium]